MRAGPPDGALLGSSGDPASPEAAAAASQSGLAGEAERPRRSGLAAAVGATALASQLAARSSSSGAPSLFSALRSDGLAGMPRSGLAAAEKPRRKPQGRYVGCRLTYSDASSSLMGET